MMTNRERVLAILDGKSPDRIPWIPRLQLWYNARLAEGNMPERYRGLSLRELERALGVGTPGKAGRIFKTRTEGLEVRETKRGGELLREYVTPVGTVSELHIRSEGLTSYTDAHLPQEFRIKGAADYAVVEYIYEHTHFEPTYDEYLRYEKEVGDDGYPMLHIGDCPFHYFLLHLAGYNNAYFQLADHLPQIEHLLKVMEQVELERMWPVVWDSPARLFCHGTHFDSQMTPPRLFAAYITPYYQKVTPRLRARGQRLAYHADDDSQNLLELVKESGFDMAECFVTAPMVNVTLAEARRAWGKDVAIFGGIPSVILEEEAMTDGEFEDYVRDLFRTIAPGDAFILGVADNVMPRSKIERVGRVTQMVEELGAYPIKA